MPASTAKARRTAMSDRQRQTTKAAPMTTTSSAAKLDCENEISRPSHATTSTAVAMTAERSERPSTTKTSDGAIATTRNGAYAFELITFGFWKMSRVSYW